MRSNCSSSSVARERASALGQLVEPAEHPQVLATGEVLVHRRVLTGESDHATAAPGPGARRRSRPRWRGPHPACSSVARMRTVVVLPAPLGPSRPRTLPSCDGQVQPVEGAHLVLARAVDLDQALGFDDVHVVRTCRFRWPPIEANPTTAVWISRPRRPMTVGIGPIFKCWDRRHPSGMPSEPILAGTP